MFVICIKFIWLVVKEISTWVIMMIAVSIGILNQVLIANPLAKFVIKSSARLGNHQSELDTLVLEARKFRNGNGKTPDSQ